MDKFFEWLSSNPVATIIIVVMVVMVLGSFVMIYLFAFIQGRDISFWQLKIGARPEKSKSEESSLHSPSLTDPKVRTYLSREDAYSTIPEVIARVDREQKGPKQLLLAALHGHSGDRRVSPSAPIPAFEAFDATLLRCVKSFGPDMWSVHELYNVTTEDRLNQIIGWLRNTKDDDGYEVRAFCVPDAIPLLAPLVIGANDVFLGIEDPRYYRVRGVIHIKDRNAATYAINYFESLWNDPRVIVLRSAVGIEETNISTLRQRVKSMRAEA